MKMSRYNMFLPRDDGTVIAFNSRTTALITLTERSHCILEEASSTGGLDRIPIGMRLVLGEFGFVINDEMDELLEIRSRVFQSRFSAGSLSLTILPTLACNLRCVYCFESGTLQPGIMSREIEDSLICFIRERTPAAGRVNVTWYGGEPLLAPDLIVRASRAIGKIAGDKGSRLIVGMVTNGTLLTQSMLESLEDVGLSSIQITLDGPKDVNDMRKPFADSHGSSFDTVMKNLRSLKPSRARIAVRCNIDKRNKDSVVDLLPELKSLNLPGLVAYAAPVIPWVGEGCPQIDDACLREADFRPVEKQFTECAKMMGIGPNQKPKPRTHYCTADSASSFVVAPDGSLYKCWSYVGDKRWRIGNVLTGPTVLCPPCAQALLFDPTQEPKCRECNYLPLCLGGCPAQSENSGERYCGGMKHRIDDVLRDWVQEWEDSHVSSDPAKS